MKKQLFIVGTVLTLTFSGLGFTGIANAETNISEKKENVSQNLNKVETDILGSAKKVNEINLDIDSLESALVTNEEEVERVTKEAEKYETEIKGLKEDINSLEDEIKARNEILKERLSSYQNSGGDLGFMEVIFGSKGFEEFISRFTAVTTITKADNKLVEEQKNAINEVEKKEVEVKEKLTATENTKKELTQINKEQKTQKKELTASKKAVESKVSELEEKKSAYIAEGNDLDALEKKIEAEIKATEAGLSENTETSAPNDLEEPQSDEASENSEEATEETIETVETTNTSNSNDSSSSNNTTNSSASNNTSTEASSNNSSANSSSASSSSNESSTSANTNSTSASTKKAEVKSKPKPKPKPKPSPKPSPKPATSGGKGIISDARALLGTPYELGGTTPAEFDCSGYTSFVYRQNGINLPRTAAQQYAAYPKVSKGQLRAGDLVFFTASKNSSSITHVGISLGGSQYIGSQTSTGVAISSINDPYYWGERYAGAARPN